MKNLLDETDLELMNFVMDALEDADLPPEGVEILIHYGAPGEFPTFEAHPLGESEA